VGLPLKEIRDGQLYLDDGCESFQEYMKKRKEYGFSESRASQIISAAELRKTLPSLPKVNSGPIWTEKSVRELNRLGSDTKAKAVAARVLKEVEKHGGKLTSKVVRKAVKVS